MPFRETGFFGKPEIGIGIDIIGKCNLRCRQCFFEKDPSTRKMMSFEQVKFIIEATADKFSELYILGGEPTLHPQLPQILSLGLEHMPVVILVTNGLKLAKKDYCQKIALPRLQISTHRQAINSSARETVDYLVQRKGIFELTNMAWKNIEKYWQGIVCVQLNLLKPLVDGGHVMDVFQWARSKNYEPIMELTKPGPIFERGHKLDVPVQRVQELYNKMLEYDRKYYPHLSEQIPAIVPPSYGHNCTLVETGVHVRVDGTVIPCVAHTTLPLGNIFKDNIETMLASKIRLAIKDYQNWIVGPCRQCRHFEYCHGGCRGEAFWDTGCPRASDSYCWHFPKGISLQDLTLVSCAGCILENHPGCKIKNRRT